MLSVLLGKKSSFVIEDLIRIVWLLASNDQVKVPMAWIEDFKMNAKRVKTPPTLPPVELEALIGNFHYFASDGGVSVSFEELVASGLLDADQASRYMTEYDSSGDGELDVMWLQDRGDEEASPEHRQKQRGYLEVVRGVRGTCPT